MPQCCCDFAEVLHAFQVGLDRLDIERITRHAARLGVAAVKRLGWDLDTTATIRQASISWLHCRSNVMVSPDDAH